MLERCIKMDLIDLFAGISAIKLSFENVGFQSVFWNDFDSYCKTTWV
jgi:site-specific DNA-cytosine methylase